MSLPAASPSALELYGELGVYTAGQEDLDFPLLRFIDAACRVFVEPVAEIVQERDGLVSWERLFDPDLCPEEFLPYLAQYVGAELTPDLSEQDKRDKISQPETWQRGTVPALIADVKRTLTGTKTVLVAPRYQGFAYRLKVRTLASETPSTGLTRAAVLRHKPKGTVLILDHVTAQDYDDVASKSDDYDDVASDYVDYTDVATTLP